jgi:hypothetical protein
MGGLKPNRGNLSRGRIPSEAVFPGPTRHRKAPDTRDPTSDLKKRQSGVNPDRFAKIRVCGSGKAHFYPPDPGRGTPPRGTPAEVSLNAAVRFPRPAPPIRARHGRFRRPAMLCFGFIRPTSAGAQGAPYLTGYHWERGLGPSSEALRGPRGGPGQGAGQGPGGPPGAPARRLGRRWIPWAPRTTGARQDPEGLGRIPRVKAGSRG